MRNLNGRLLTAAFLLSASLLMLEVLAMRQWKLSLGRDVAFIMVPSVMLGLALGSIAAFLLGLHYPRHLQRLASWCAACYALTSPLPFWLLASTAGRYHQLMAADSIELTAAELQLCIVAGMAGLLGFALAGCCNALLFRLPVEPHQLYASTLVGAGVGACASLWLENLVGLPTAQAVTVAVAATSVLPFLWPSRRVLSVVVMAAALAAAWALPDRFAIRRGSGPVTSDATAQIEVEPWDKTDTLREASDEFNAALVPDSVKVWGVDIDEAAHSTRIVRYERLADCAFFKHAIGYAAFVAAQPQRTLIIGSGGGADVVEALVAGCPAVTAVELNPLIVKAARDMGSRAYDEPGVRAVVGDGRKFLAADSESRFDLIYLPNVKTYGGVGFGGYGVLKDYVLTREGLRLCRRHLTPDGVLAIRDGNWTLRWHLATLLAAEPQAEVENHLVMVSGKVVSLLLYCPAGFDAARMRRLQQYCAAERLPLSVRALEAEDLSHYVSTDDRPYMWWLLSRRLVPGGEPGGGALKRLFASYWKMSSVAAVVAVAVVLLPWILARTVSSVAPLLLFFAASGAGFTLVELVFMETFMLVLGQPGLAVGAVLGGVLVFAGVGSLLLRRGSPMALALACVLAQAAAFWGVNWLATHAAGASPQTLLAACVVLLMPAGLAMGTLFPLGLRLAAARSESLIPWMWGANAAAAVVAGLSTRGLFFYGGYRLSMAVAAGLYLAAGAALWYLQRREPP